MKKITLLLAFLATVLGANAQIYSENFTDQEDKGQVGIINDVTDVTWFINVSEGAFTATSDYLAVKSGVFTARDVDGLVTWQSPNIDITGLTNLNIALDVGASGDFEVSGDVFKIEFVVDNTPEIVFEGVVDEDAPGDPFFFGSTQLSSTLQDFSKTIVSTGTTGYLKISCNVNAGTEILYFDNIVVTGETLSIKNDRIPGLITTAKEGKITTNKGAIKAIYNITGQEVKNEDLVSGVYIVHVTEGANNEIQKVVVK